MTLDDQSYSEKSAGVSVPSLEALGLPETLRGLLLIHRLIEIARRILGGVIAAFR